MSVYENEEWQTQQKYIHKSKQSKIVTESSKRRTNKHTYAIDRSEYIEKEEGNIQNCMTNSWREWEDELEKKIKQQLKK